MSRPRLLTLPAIVVFAVLAPWLATAAGAAALARTASGPRAVAASGAVAGLPIRNTGGDAAAPLGDARSGTAGVRDDRGVSMDTLKIVGSAPGRFLGVYQDCTSQGCRVDLAESADLGTWRYVRVLDGAASQPYLRADEAGGWVLADEADAGHHIRLVHYAGLSALRAGAADRRFDAPRTLSACAEGTPSIETATKAVIRLRLHYFAGCLTDREAVATLRGWTSWHAAPDARMDGALLRAGAAGKHGDRDTLAVNGRSLVLVEAQLRNGDWASWRLFAYDPATGAAHQLPVAAPGGATGFANPAGSWVTTSAGSQVLVLSAFVPSESAGHTPAGELVWIAATNPQNWPPIARIARETSQIGRQ